MPLYEYKCRKCGQESTMLRSVADRNKPIKSCSECDSDSHELVVQTPSFTFREANLRKKQPAGMRNMMDHAANFNQKHKIKEV